MQLTRYQADAIFLHPLQVSIIVAADRATARLNVMPRQAWVVCLQHVVSMPEDPVSWNFDV